jgi:hypothetical protein
VFIELRAQVSFGLLLRLQSVELTVDFLKAQEGHDLEQQVHWI